MRQPFQCWEGQLAPLFIMSGISVKMTSNSWWGYITTIRNGSQLSELSFSGAEKKSPAETEYGQLMKGLQGTILMSLRIGLVVKEVSDESVPNLLLR